MRVCWLWPIFMIPVFMTVSCASISSSSEDAGAIRSVEAGRDAALLSKRKKEKRVENATAQLAAQELQPGDCGLFAWTNDIEKNFVFFGKSQQRNAKIMIDDTQIDLKMVSGEGLAVFSQFPTQTLVDPLNDREYRIALAYPEQIDHATRFKKGVLSWSSLDGWSKTIPIVGLATCL